MRWSLLKDSARLKPEAATDRDALIAKMATVRAARAWIHKERLREILPRKQVNVVRSMLQHCRSPRNSYTLFQGRLTRARGWVAQK